MAKEFNNLRLKVIGKHYYADVQPTYVQAEINGITFKKKHIDVRMSVPKGTTESMEKHMQFFNKTKLGDWIVVDGLGETRITHMKYGNIGYRIIVHANRIYNQTRKETWIMPDIKQKGK